MSTNLTRISGMYSGFDTDQLVTDLIKAESVKVDKVKQDKIYAEWQQEAYREIINDIRGFKDEFFSVTKPETNFRSTSSFIGYETNMKNEDDSWYVDVNVGSASITGNYSITSIALAKSAIKEGNDTYLSGNTDLDKTLAELHYDSGVEFTIETTNSAGEIKNKTIVCNSGTKLSDVFSEVNSEDLGIKMYYDEIKNKVIVKSEETGSGVKINKISDNVGALINNLELTTADTDNVIGSDANVTIKDESGASKTVESSTNSVAVNGIELNLKENFPVGSETIDFGVAANPQKIVDNVKSFVEKYNAMIEKIDDKLKEKINYDYSPLTEEQKKDLSDDEVETWEEKAKSGLLKRDTTLSSFLSNLRNVLYDEVDGMHIFDIGITTSSDRSKPGQLSIDEDKLKEAIEEDSQKVANLFAKEDTGLANKIYDIIEENVTTSTNSDGSKGFLLEKAGMEGDTTEINNYLSDKITDYEDTVREMLDDLTKKENYYYTMFAKMEKALSEMQSQSSWLSGMGS